MGPQDPNSPGNPGQDPVDLYVAVKYAEFFSIFYYGNVTPGDVGQLTSDGANLIPANLDLTLPGYSPGCGFSYGTGCDPTNSSDPLYCMVYKSNGQGPSAAGISGGVGYWPLGDVVIPVPPAIILLGTAIASLAGFAGMRRRRTAA